MPGITLNAVSLAHAGYRVFDCLCLHLASGQWHSVLGRSGVGKTSLLRLIAGLQQPDSGRIDSTHRRFTHNRSTRSLPEQARQTCSGSTPVGTPQARSLDLAFAYIPQEDSLLPWLSVIDNVLLGPRLRHSCSDSTRDRAHSLLAQVGLAQWSIALPGSLSGGMRQRVALARTLLEDPPVVLMDEPYSRLDAITRHELQALSAELLSGRTVVLVTHDPGEALRLSQVVHVLQPGSPTHCHSIALPHSTPRELDNPTIARYIPELWALLQAEPALTTMQDTR